jgi:hypothetical protein
MPLSFLPSMAIHPVTENTPFLNGNADNANDQNSYRYFKWREPCKTISFASVLGLLWSKVCCAVVMCVGCFVILERLVQLFGSPLNHVCSSHLLLCCYLHSETLGGGYWFAGTVNGVAIGQGLVSLSSHVPSLSRTLVYRQ